jgi:hypothetical protein
MPARGSRAEPLSRPEAFSQMVIAKKRQSTQAFRRRTPVHSYSKDSAVFVKML